MGWSCCDEQYDEGFKAAADIWKTRALEVEKNFGELVHKSGEKIYKLEQDLAAANAEIERLRKAWTKQRDEVDRMAGVVMERDRRLAAANARVHYAEGTAQANIDRANDAEAQLEIARAEIKQLRKIIADMNYEIAVRDRIDA